MFAEGINMLNICCREEETVDQWHRKLPNGTEMLLRNWNLQFYHSLCNCSPQCSASEATIRQDYFQGWEIEGGKNQKVISEWGYSPFSLLTIYRKIQHFPGPITLFGKPLLSEVCLYDNFCGGILMYQWGIAFVIFHGLWSLNRGRKQILWIILVFFHILGCSSWMSV